MLGRFLASEETVSGAARSLKLDLRIVHRDVQALAKAGLLRVTRWEPRSGRAVAHYRASAGAYFVPQSLHPAADQGEELRREFGPFDDILNVALGREFERALRESGQREWGTRLFQSEGGPDSDQCFYDAELRSVLTGWQGPEMLAFTSAATVRLTDEEAKGIQRELIELALRLVALSNDNGAQDQGRPFGLRSVMTPLDENDLLKIKSR